MGHVLSDDLERYCLGIVGESECSTIEQHLLWCRDCLDVMEAVERFVRLVWSGIIRGSFEVELLAEECRHKRTSGLVP